MKRIWNAHKHADFRNEHRCQLRWPGATIAGARSPARRRQQERVDSGDSSAGCIRTALQLVNRGRQLHGGIQRRIENATIKRHPEPRGETRDFDALVRQRDLESCSGPDRYWLAERGEIAPEPTLIGGEIMCPPIRK